MDDTHPGPAAARSVPPALASALERAFGLTSPPETLGEWVTATEGLLGSVGMTVTYEELCTTDDGPHEATLDGRTQAFVCVLDTFLLPYASDVSGPIEVESTTPAGETVRFSVSRSEIQTAPETAVISFGVSTDVEPVDPATISPEHAYQHLCPYIHAFPSEAAYASWAAELDGAATMVLPAAAGFELAGLIAGGEQFFPGGVSA